MTDLKPSVRNCWTLLSNLQQTCLQHGIELAYHKQLFQTIDNIMQLIENDDPAYYLLFLEDVFPYMEKYKYQPGMQQVLTELEVLLSNQMIGSVSDRALFLDYQAVLEKDPKKALKMAEQAVGMITDITPDNALLVANLTSNLGGLYYHCGKIDLGKQHYEKAIHIMEQYQSSAIFFSPTNSSSTFFHFRKILSFFLGRKSLLNFNPYSMKQHLRSTNACLKILIVSKTEHGNSTGNRSRNAAKCIRHRNSKKAEKNHRISHCNIVLHLCRALYY